jgi:hypothetical protein
MITEMVPSTQSATTAARRGKAAGLRVALTRPAALCQNGAELLKEKLKT